MYIKAFYFAFLFLILILTPAYGQKPKVSQHTQGNKICIESNGIPNHETGTFPNKGNPNTITEQNHHFCFAAKPVLGAKAQPKRGIIGIAINGIPMEPGTAEWFDNDPSSGWNYCALEGSIDLGMDRNNAHVQPGGMYHYHGIPYGLISTLKAPDAVLGYAADGFPIYANAKKYKTSYVLKKGKRPSGPGGNYDGTFVEDWEYRKGAGDLDECNGRKDNDTYFYVVTRDFPQLPRCLKGAVTDDSFTHHPQHHPLMGKSEQKRPPHPKHAPPKKK